MHFILNGTHPTLGPALHAAGLDSAALLINLDPDTAIASAEKFADAVPPGQEALVVNILYAHAADDWNAARAAAILWAFTRHTALAWAPRRIRVNAIGLGISPVLPSQPAESAGQAAGPAPSVPATVQDLVATVRAMWEFPSMTGQLIRLGAP